jgi:hypothetical protein
MECGVDRNALQRPMDGNEAVTCAMDIAHPRDCLSGYFRSDEHSGFSSSGARALVVDAHQHVIEDKWRRGRRVAAAASREDTQIGSADAGTIA